jgi:hypothetical protein
MNLINEHDHSTWENNETSGPGPYKCNPPPLLDWGKSDSYPLYTPGTQKHVIFSAWVCAGKCHPLGCAEACELIQGTNAGYWDTNVHIPGLLLPFLFPAAPRSERPYSPKLHTSNLPIKVKFATWHYFCEDKMLCESWSFQLWTFILWSSQLWLHVIWYEDHVAAIFRAR